MKDEQLERILKNIDILECKPIIDNYVFYVKKRIKSRISKENGKYGYGFDEYEFLVIAPKSEKQGIILRLGTSDLHWLVLHSWRNKHVLSNALRKDIIHNVWPENKTITCRYSWRDKVVDRPEKYRMTKHLSEIAGLELIDAES